MRGMEEQAGSGATLPGTVTSLRQSSTYYVEMIVAVSEAALHSVCSFRTEVLVSHFLWLAFLSESRL